MTYTLPNLLTLFRIILVPVFLALFFAPVLRGVGATLLLAAIGYAVSVVRGRATFGIGGFDVSVPTGPFLAGQIGVTAARQADRNGASDHLPRPRPCSHPPSTPETG